ncbi:B-cell antigen receptor complex-associated protein alpha chain isoform X1 [Stegastes partitus]|uniref:B-cell antigen receptor complex-associated protein alpha chain isoform X1 n=1 Tax=Stegastes partitus TaxID=144197 RepID=A0A3B4ZUI7_9TELE|nr:PREDICTED: B-cell antigen receptor complex-associated protein alpha chain isoform X1 [Stegastes partitus]
MGIAVIFVLCSLAVGITRTEVILKADRPYLRVLVSDVPQLFCCYKGKPELVTWFKRRKSGNGTVSVQSNRVLQNMPSEDDTLCSILTFAPVQVNDSGLYQCLLNSSKEFTHGTYLHVYKPLEKTIDMTESTKNKILTAEGILLLLCVLVPSATLLFKSKTLHELQKKKEKKEEENIYQGLNLDDCCATYDQIERSQAMGQYQDVANIVEEGEEAQLEKP